MSCRMTSSYSVLGYVDGLGAQKVKENLAKLMVWSDSACNERVMLKRFLQVKRQVQLALPRPPAAVLLSGTALFCESSSYFDDV